MKGAGGHELRIYGDLELRITVMTKHKNQRTVEIQAIVASLQNTALILGTDFCAKLRPEFDFVQGTVTFDDSNTEFTDIVANPIQTLTLKHEANDDERENITFYGNGHIQSYSSENGRIAQEKAITIKERSTDSISAKVKESVVSQESRMLVNEPSAITLERDIIVKERRKPIKSNDLLQAMRHKKASSVLAHCAEDTELPPNSVTTVKVSAAEKANYANGLSVVYPKHDSLGSAFEILDSLVSFYDGSAYVNAINKTEEIQDLKAIK